MKKEKKKKTFMKGRKDWSRSINYGWGLSKETSVYSVTRSFGTGVSTTSTLEPLLLPDSSVSLGLRSVAIYEPKVCQTTQTLEKASGPSGEPQFSIVSSAAGPVLKAE